jgi:hypothetical protein
MNGCPDSLYRVSKQRRECARDSVGDVDSLRIINVHIDDRSDAPLEDWQDRLKRQRRKKKPQPGQTEPPGAPGREPPDSLIDEYAAPS